MSKKFPIRQKAVVEIFGKACGSHKELLDALDEKEKETILGRISYIVRTLSPDTLSLDVKNRGIDLDGNLLKAVKKDGDTIIFDFDGEKIPEQEFVLDDVIHVCFQLEQRYVAPGARFVTVDPYCYDDGDEFSGGDFESLVADFQERLDDVVYNDCNPGDIASVVLPFAATMLAITDDPEEACREFTDCTKELTKEYRSGIPKETPHFS